MITQEERSMPVNRRSSGTSELNSWLPGIALVALGLILLLGQVLSAELAGVLIVPALALVFIFWGIATRQVGVLIPGGILAGIGAGSAMLVYDWPFGNLSGDMEAGAFMLAFALGWASITLLSLLFTDRAHWWPLVPGGIFAAIGSALLIGGTALEVLALIGYIWPLAFIAAGLYLILRRRAPMDI